ncbi:MAG: type III PLP-dependent enzyme [Alphaproteobacteria bacterium]|nr:type III PLP-dependent enzyme [Alphaproteobacteria bacterium]
MDDYDGPDEVVRQLRPDIPVTCFRPAALESAARWFLTNFPGKVLYAVKANPAPYVLSGLHAAGITHFDAASVPEIQLVHSLCPGAHIAFMHPVKSRHAIEQAYFDFGIRDFSFDSMEELEKIVACTGKSKDLGLMLRLAVPNTASELPLSGKFGCPPEKAVAILKAARKLAARIGICFHVGSQTMDPQAYVAALAIVGTILRAMPRTKVDVIDIGGGFPSVYPDMAPPALADYKTAIDAGLDALPHPERYDFWCEPGRALVAESASVVVQVELRKDDVLYINDGTYGSLFDAGHMGFRYPVRLIRPTPGGTDAALKGFRFYGPTCDSIDYMPGPFFLPEDVREGDYIEIGQLGAYGNTMRTDFNGFSAHEVVSVKTPPLVTLYDDALETTDPKELCVA